MCILEIQMDDDECHNKYYKFDTYEEAADFAKYLKERHGIDENNVNIISNFENPSDKIDLYIECLFLFEINQGKPWISFYNTELTENQYCVSKNPKVKYFTAYNAYGIYIGYDPNETTFEQIKKKALELGVRFFANRSKAS